MSRRKDKGEVPWENLLHEAGFPELAGKGYIDKLAALASIPEEEFRTILDKVKRQDEELTDAGILREARRRGFGAAPRKGRGRSQETKGLIAIMVEIAEEIQPCNLRALAYQLFNRKLITSMSDTKQTGKVSRLSVIAREEGLLPWEWIVDPSRSLETVPTWADPEHYADTVQRAYRKDKWLDQPVAISLWSEKATVEGTLRPVLWKYEIPFLVLHGWSGSTPIHDAAEQAIADDKPTIILYVGDYDPSGMGMSELDLPQRIARYALGIRKEDMDIEYARRILEEHDIEIRRIALTEHHTKLLGKETSFPAETKKNDSRYAWFVKHYGRSCWELDAMKPTDLRDIVEETILDELDRESWDRHVDVEGQERAAIVGLLKSWKDIPGPGRE
jgi:hypothetical protein